MMLADWAKAGFTGIEKEYAAIGIIIKEGGKHRVNAFNFSVF